MEIVDTIIVSDIHLGSKISRSKELVKTLELFTFKKLILNGDIFDDLNFKRLRRSDWDFLFYLRIISNPQNNIEVIWIRGNHDNLLVDLTLYFLGIKVRQEYEWIYGNKKNIAIHGDQFDDFLLRNKTLTKLATYVFSLIQKIDSEKQRPSRFIMRLFNRIYLRSSNKISNKAADYCKTKNAHNIFCGHTHQLATKKYDDITYYNSGCWTDIPSTFITILEEKIEIRKVY